MHDPCKISDLLGLGIECILPPLVCHYEGLFPGMAKDLVNSLARFNASCSLLFHNSATLLSRGSSGLGALIKAWIDSKTVLICNAGLHLSFKISKQIRPSLSTLG